MIWGLFATLGHNMWAKEATTLTFSEDAWRKVTDAAQKGGINTIILDLGEGVAWESHPELAAIGAWDRKKIKSEVLRLREMGINLVPKMNFSTCHDLWLKQYRLELGKPIYYQTVRDLILEAYDLFLQPEYIHLGMDEEGDLTNIVCGYPDPIRFRKRDMLWRDLNWMLNVVRSTGATPWIWADFCVNHMHDDFLKNVKSDDLLMSPWYYNAIKPEHFELLVEGTDKYINAQRYPYNHMNLKYEEDRPLLKMCRQYMAEAAQLGYDIVPCTSDVFKCPYNTEDVFEHIIENAPADKVKGFMTAPWVHTLDDGADEIIHNIELLSAAKKKYFGE